MNRALLLGSALLAAIFLSAAQAKEYEVLHSFDGSDGSYPIGNLQLDEAGNIYGATALGGSFAHGTIFEVSPAGEFSVMYAFTGGADGDSPQGGLTIDPATGDVYGTTEGGGFGHGVIFRMTAAGALTVLHDFNPDSDGWGPQAALTRDRRGNFYGTTYEGGSSNRGTVFELTTNGKFKVVHVLQGEDGANPFGRLARKGSDLYGVTELGGSNCCGTMFKVTADGSFTTLYSPVGGVGLSGGMARDDAGNLYGPAGWAPNGSIYALTPEGTFSTLHAFGGADGRFPGGDLLLSKRGMIYGAAGRGGGSDHGTIFRLDLQGNFKVLHDFTGNDGSSPSGGLVRGKDGALYGTTRGGGSHNLGVVFRVAMH